MLYGLGVMILWMALFWGASRLTSNSSLVDTAWSLGTGLLAVLYFFLSPYRDFRQFALLLCVAAWSLRLAGLLIQRLLRGHKDRRYDVLDAAWDGWRYFLFYQAQAVAAVVLSIPFALAMQNGAPTTVTDWLGLLLFIAAFTGEVVADGQMSAFRADPKNRGAVCEVGLWRLSRHPNYFFEWLIWISFSLFALAAPYGWLGLVSPLLIYLLLTRVTGIPPTEEALLKSKGEKYRAYMRSTNAFFPDYRKLKIWR